MDELKYNDRVVRKGFSYIRCRGIPFHFRNGSVPGIRNSHFHRGVSYRHPHTQSEYRAEYLAESDDHSAVTTANLVKLTAVRDLPVAWDELPRHTSRNCSWKRFRDTQYHPR